MNPYKVLVITNSREGFDRPERTVRTRRRNAMFNKLLMGAMLAFMLAIAPTQSQAQVVAPVVAASSVPVAILAVAAVAYSMPILFPLVTFESDARPFEAIFPSVEYKYPKG